ncbi:hypothetical protein C8F04DRAFT_1242803 [Mycena alexandri]|uniref:Uncharacterized protein n=1 Tax=Mycena alexandri TaxID=1745969 RepID=A0AAD6S4X6_9AGAR|nr:hypothetical protein C8F04DRAFT_1242803 [Mycena alexandri]
MSDNLCFLDSDVDAGKFPGVSGTKATELKKRAITSKSRAIPDSARMAPVKTSAKHSGPRLASAKNSTGAPAPRVKIGGASAVASAVVPMDPPFPPYQSFDTTSSLVLSGPDFKITGLCSLHPEINLQGDSLLRPAGNARTVATLSFAAQCTASIAHVFRVSKTLPLLSESCPSFARLATSRESRHLYKDWAKTTAPRDMRASAAELMSTPIPALVHKLRMLFPNNFAYLEIFFDLHDPTHHSTLESSNTALENSLLTGELKSVRKIFTVVVSHATPDGFLHYTPNGVASDSAHSVLECLMPPRLLRAFRKCDRLSSDHLLAILTCGYIFTKTESVGTLANMADEQGMPWGAIRVLFTSVVVGNHRVDTFGTTLPEHHLECPFRLHVRIAAILSVWFCIKIEGPSLI